MTKNLALMSLMTIGLTAHAIADDPTTNTASEPLYGAELFSFETVQYGKFVFRARLLSAPGVVSSFFTYDNQSWAGNEIPWREIDIEVIGSEPDLMQTNIITGHSEDKVMSEDHSTIEHINWFHTYTLEWTPDVVRWQVDGVTVREDFATDSQQIVDLRDTPQTYRANVWVSEVVDWVGVFDESTLPLYQVFDWIEYHEWQDGEYEFSWRDDFSTMDNTRWGKGDWTFDTNLVTFAPENMDVIDDHLVLALTAGDKGIDQDHYRAQVNIAPIANLQFLQDGEFITEFDPDGTAITILPELLDGNGDTVIIDKLLVNDEEVAADANDQYQVPTSALSDTNEITLYFHDDREPDNQQTTVTELKKRTAPAAGGCTYAGPGGGGDLSLIVLLALSGLYGLRKLFRHG
ncbi:family 16 glycosylhydrolase [Reinekea blandensis]|nr:family 16 glycosylhydrolase [Reinekea blandensis]